jgi:hypothetical protein
MSKKKLSRIATQEQKLLELTYYVGGIKTRFDLFEKTLSEYIEYKKDWKEFNKFIEKRKKEFDKKNK